MKSTYLIVLALLYPLIAFGQQIEGTVSDTNGEKLVGANLFWLGTTIGTATNASGTFKVEQIAGNNRLVVSFIGYKTDTLTVTGTAALSVKLQADDELEAIDVVHRKRSTEVSYTKPIKVEQIGEKELLKAACCNLSESFETSPTVDVSFTDAVTGTRQIQMLGLAGPYVQITRENMPNIRGLSSAYGLTYIPGTWVESIQLNKGTGSVVNGFESIAGQINVELRKPETADRLYLNLYGNVEGSMEANLNLAHKFKNEKWSTGLLLHATNNSVKLDHNYDGFMDMPIGNRFIAVNRWKYIGAKGLRVQLGAKATKVETQGGQLAYQPSDAPSANDHWGMDLGTQRLEAWAKIGKVYEATPWRTMGLQLSAVNHQQNSTFGLRNYNAAQNSFYANYLYQSIISNTNHKFVTGASFQYDEYTENLDQLNLDRTEAVPGAYFEYTYTFTEKFSAVAGARADYHNHFGLFLTPRTHIRFAPTESTVLRASAGRGQRSANVLAENSGLLSSSRVIEIVGDQSDMFFGLKPEVAWNMGLNLTQFFKLDYREGSIQFDFYRTDFSNQIILDLEQSPQKAVFYNLNGKSYANSFQAQVDYELIKRLDARVAYRWYDVKTDYNGELLQKPLIGMHRAFFNVGYETRSHWKFDYTVNWQGAKRIPTTASNPVEYQLPETSPSFVLMNAQVSKTLLEKLELYLGGENLTGFKQKSPILSSAQPFSPYFDGTLIWGPIYGRKIYFGLRYRLK